MAKKLTSVLGIDIGSQNIKVAEVRAQGKDAVVSALGVIATPEGAVDHTGIFNSDAVGAALKQVLTECGASAPAAVVSIAGQASVLVRTLEVPRMNPAELKEHMQWEINRNIPFAESTVVSDYKPLGDEDPNSTNMDVVMAISPQSAVDTVIASVKKAGKTTAAIDVEPLSIARSMVQSYDDVYHNQTVCVVEMGHKTTSINIYKNGKLLMPRQIPVGGEMFTKAVSDALQISNSESEDVKVREGEIPESAADAMAGTPDAFGGATQSFTPYNPFSDEPAPVANPFPENLPDAPEPGASTPAPVHAAAGGGNVQLYNAFAPVLEEFVAEVRRSIDYYRSRGGDIDRIVLAGGAAKLKGLQSFLKKSLGLECDVYDPLRRLNVTAKKLAPGMLEEHRQDFVVAVGNGLHILFD
ncbi:MAG: type IV pilus assembly protein PilM [Fimbriimonadaceae bacterium]|nr:type IV pilus assembly protein PilM [Fimbriimonadaceae bacterium]